MAVLTLEQRVEKLTGRALTELDALSHHLRDAVIDVTNRWIATHPEDVFLFLRESAEQSGGNFNIEGAEVVSVVRKVKEDDWRGCTEIPHHLQSRTKDINSIHYVSKFNPAFIRHSQGNISVIPISTSDSKFKVYYVNNKPENKLGADLYCTDTEINYFPLGKIDLVILKASIAELGDAMSKVIPGESAAITAIFAESQTELDSCKSLCDNVNTHIANAVTKLGYVHSEILLANIELDKMEAEIEHDNAELDLAKAEIAESVVNVDNEIDTAQDAITTAAGRINTAVALANVEFDKGSNLLDLGETDSEGAVNTALGLLKIAVDQAAAEADKFIVADADSIFGDEDTFLTDVSQLKRVKDALDNAEKIIDDGANSPTGNAAGDAASYLYDEEDLELVQGAVAIASSEIQRAQAHLSEWTSIGGMRMKSIEAALAEGNGYANEIKTRLAQAATKREETKARLGLGASFLEEAKTGSLEVQSYSQEVQSRIAQVQGQLAVAQGYIATGAGYSRVAKGYATIAQGFISTASAYLQEANGYFTASKSISGEIQTRISLAVSFQKEIQLRILEMKSQTDQIQTQLILYKRQYDEAFMYNMPKLMQQRQQQQAQQRQQAQRRGRR